MDLQVVLGQRTKVEEFQRKHRIVLLTLLFTDPVGSTKLKQELWSWARDWHRKNLFVQAGLGLKVGFSNYGPHLKPIGKQSRKQLVKSTWIPHGTASDATFLRRAASPMRIDGSPVVSLPCTRHIS